MHLQRYKEHAMKESHTEEKTLILPNENPKPHSKEKIYI
jgi:hypothetical protein